MHILLFDIDGTLVNSGGAGKAAIEDALTGEFGEPGLHLNVGFMKHAVSQRVVHPVFDPMDQLEPAIEVLNKRGAALDPIAVIAI